jgi:hypothetical protein
MLRHFSAAILAGSLATASADAATFVMGNALYSYCVVPIQDETAASICMGYIDQRPTTFELVTPTMAALLCANA